LILAGLVLEQQVSLAILFNLDARFAGLKYLIWRWM